LHGILKNGTLAAMGVSVLKTPLANRKRTSMLYKVFSTYTRKFVAGLCVKVIHLPSFLPWHIELRIHPLEEITSLFIQKHMYCSGIFVSLSCVI
jgi:hypothetical protein